MKKINNNKEHFQPVSAIYELIKVCEVNCFVFVISNDLSCFNHYDVNDSLVILIVKDYPVGHQSMY